MRLSLARLIPALLLALAALPGAAVARLGAPALDSVSADFQREFDQTMAEERIPGAAWAIVAGDQLYRYGTHGRTGDPTSPSIDGHTVFRIASVSKGFAGTLAALLAAEGRFDLADPVAPYAPSFGFRPPAGPPLTIQDVLGQRSGFVPNAFDNLIEAGTPREEIYPRFRDLEPICPPGQCYSYQNSVFSLIEEVVQQTTSVPYGELLRRRLFEPLGMARSSLGYDAFVATDNRALPHLKTRAGWRQVRPRSTYYQVGSAAGVNASVLDMAQWAIAMLGHRPGVLPPETIREVLTPRVRTARDLRHRHWRDRIDDAHYGLGWRIYEVDGHELALHSGWVAGYRAEIALSREFDVGIVILMNAESRAVGALDRAFWDAVLREAGTSPSPG